MKKLLAALSIFFSIHQNISAQFGSPAWKGKKCAVVITYDDAINQHLDNAVPVLDSLGLKASFYLTAFSSSMQTRLNDWKKLAATGHELGNHTLYHPCVGGIKGREWVSSENDLSKYTLKRIENEVRMTNHFLRALDGKAKRTFAFTCGDMIVEGKPFIDGMKNDFVAARGVKAEMHKINEVDLMNVDCYVVNNHSFEQMKEWVDKALQTNSLLVVLFHGVGGGNGLDVSLAAHRKFLEYVKANEKDIYVAPLLDVAEHVKDWQSREAIRAGIQNDYNDMLTQLNIKSTRRGPSGNPQAPDAANSDELKVKPYTLPDPLKMKNGQKVNSEKTWWQKRRPEIVEDFDNEIYGRLPKNIPPVKWTIVSVKDTMIGNYKGKEKTLKGTVDNASHPAIKVEIELVLVTPANQTNAVPVVTEFGFIRSPFGNNTAITPIGLGSSNEPTWKEQLLAKGWGYAIIVPNSIQADNGAGLRQGIIGLVNKGEARKPEDWGALRAWAWGASRAIDYFETDKDVDTKRLAIEGLSRYGKATVLTMAYEPRFSLAFIGSSGAGGTKILRRVFGEQVENLASSGGYHWFAGNFIKYASTLTPNNLPVDAHELVALCAPRPVFISSGSPQVEGQWVDAKGMFLGGAHAGTVYKLLGKKDLGTMEFPRLGTPLVDGDIAFRQHAGGHSTGPNWSTWISWACRYWGDCKYN